MPIVLASRRARVDIAILPAAEKALLYSADIGWIIKKSIAILDNRG
jgi:hypothetical protein